MRKTTLSLSAMLLLCSCASAPTVSLPEQVQRPQLPPLAQEPLGPSFQDRMRNFLSGKLPELTSSAQPLGSVTGSTTPPAK